MEYQLVCDVIYLFIFYEKAARTFAIVKKKEKAAIKFAIVKKTMSAGGSHHRI